MFISVFNNNKESKPQLSNVEKWNYNQSDFKYYSHSISLKIITLNDMEY